MERYPTTDPATGFITQRFRMQSSLERLEYEKSILRSPPPGFVNVVKWVDEDNFTIGVEPVRVAAPKAAPEVVPGVLEPGIAGTAPIADGFDEKNDKELQTIMGLKGLRYDKKNFVRGDALARLRAAPAMTGAS